MTFLPKSVPQKKEVFMSYGRFLVFVPLLGFVCSGEPDKPPSQEAVEQAWKRADQAVQQATTAQDQAKHVAQLRDIDRMKYHAEVIDMESRIDTLRGLAVGLLL